MKSQLDRMIAARRHLLLDHPWYGALSMRLGLQEDPAVGTMGVDGSTLFYNPEWTAQLADKQLTGLWAHEVMHCVLQHPYRMGTREPETYNQAADQVVNRLVEPSAFHLPSWEKDPAVEGMYAEQAYAHYMHKKNPPKGPEPEPEGPEDAEPEKEGLPGDQDGDQDGGQDGDQDGEGTGEGDQDGDQDGEGTGEGDQDGGKQGKGSGAGSGTIPGPNAPSTVLPAPGAREDDSTEADAPGLTNPQDTGMSAVDWQIAAEEASLLMRKAGYMPAGAEIAVRLAREPQEDWREILRAFCEQNLPSDRSWSQPDRRYRALGMYVPGIVRENTARIDLGWDASGSMLGDQEMIARELTGILHDARPRSMRAIYFDSVVQHSQEFTPDDPEVKLEVRGGGGTCFQPVFDFADEHPEGPPACLVMFTDIEAYDDFREPDFPVLWVTAEFITAVGPFGQTVRVRREH